MAKNIDIMVGGTARSFSGVSKLALKETSTGNTIYFVPQDEAASYVTLITKTITENNMYFAINDGAAGYSAVYVSVQASSHEAEYALINAQTFGG